MEQYTLVKNSNNTEGQIVKGKSSPFLSLAHLYDEFEENGPIIS